MKLTESIDKLRNRLLGLSPQSQDVFANWIDVWSDYIAFEPRFNPKRLMEYRRGDILHVQFGRNVGYEESGARYAVVLDKHNSINSHTITVVPLSTLKGKKSKDTLKPSEVYLGRTIPDSEIESYALVHGIRSISKIRIIKPKSIHHEVYRLSDIQMKDISDKLEEMYGGKRDVPNVSWQAR